MAYHIPLRNEYCIYFGRSLIYLLFLNWVHGYSVHGDFYLERNVYKLYSKNHKKNRISGV
jgi:hypothetical protein